MKELYELLKWIIENMHTLSEGQQQALFEMIQVAYLKQREQQKKQIEIDLMFFKGDLGWQESTEAKRAIGCFELETNPSISRKEKESLINNDIVSEKQHGLALKEPFETILYRVASLKPIGLKIMEGLRDALRMFHCEIPKCVTEYTDRKSMAAYVSLQMPQEESLIISRTPAIFNPFEFEAHFENHTLELCKSMKHLTHRVLYVWNRDSVHAQIRSHIQSHQGPIQGLQKKIQRSFV